MPRLKDTTLSIRTSVEIKRLLRSAAELEHRSVTSMVETLVREYAHSHGLGLNPSNGEPAAIGKGIANLAVYEEGR
ncbi:type II toxin -antitoxin system TacA 1-like antitoxin [Cephaloticoccus primus]|uniref:type II toxin -antitoxin system TacA 1-like antitoxin n=1 Tax=Cephaloticoccus primus TaxID=1548207 RepID=UPI0009EE56D2|nr:DUF1778 domain-containing protein [Cephaloticoccus primus]